MREAICILIPNERALSWNEIYESRHWSKRYRLSKQKQRLVRAYMDPDDGPIDELVDIFVIATFANAENLIDSDNAVAKVYIDGLKPMLLHDDDSRYVRYVATRSMLGDVDSLEIWLKPVGGESGTSR